MVYVEKRRQNATGAESQIADAMRHLHTRQHLGKAVIVCESPRTTLSNARKQWLRLSRSLQTQRARTLNADKILKFTHSITRMQRMHFTSKTPLADPHGDVFFSSPEALNSLPVHCFSLYLIAPLTSEVQAEAIIDHMPTDGLIIDYAQQPYWKPLNLAPKTDLEKRVASEWQQVKQYLAGYNISVGELMRGGVHNVDAVDDALDTLLGVSHQFLQVANSFQHALELARPLRVSKSVSEDYDSLILLAHRVQALSPSAFARHFLEVYNNEDDTFLMRAPRAAQSGWTTETLAEALTRHTRAGRTNLAKALSLSFLGRAGSRAAG